MRSSAILRPPPQGWLSLAAFLVMLAIVGLAVGHGGPLSTRGLIEPWTLAVIMVAAGSVGYVLARSSIGIVRSHIIGAAAAAAILLVVAAAAVDGGDGRPLITWLVETDLLGERVAALRDALREETETLLTRLADPSQAAAIPVEGPRSAMLMSIVGAIAWTTGQFGASSIFRFGRGLPAATAAGVLLLFMLAVARADVPVVLSLAAFSAAAMVLLVRLQLTQQRLGWSRRHITDGGDVSRRFLRAGIAFVLATVLGASALTIVTENASVEASFDDIGFEVPDLSTWPLLDLFIAWRPGEDGPPDRLEDIARTGEHWDPGEGIAFSVDGFAPGGNYWWLAAYDTFDGRDWIRSADASSTIREANDLPVPERDMTGRIDVTTEITVGEVGFARTNAIAPSEAFRVHAASIHRTIGRGGSTAQVDFRDPIRAHREVRVDSAIIDYDPLAPIWDVDALRARGRDYPPEIARRYLGEKDAELGPRAMRFVERIEAESKALGRDDPWDLARRIEAEFRHGDYRYEPDMRGVCDGLDPAECVLTHRQGFCTYYATTMTAVLHELGVAARYVWGYLPGDEVDGRTIVPALALHAWTEVYLSGYGWIRFDPTPIGQFGQPPIADLEASTSGAGDGSIPDATPQPEPGTTADPSPSPSETDRPEEPEGDVLATVLGFIDPTGGGLRLLLIASLVFLGAMIAATIRLRRLPSGDPRLAYRGIVALATRFGHGPHPSQTELEYAATLSERIPSAQQELFLVVDASVTSAYAEGAPTPLDAEPLRRAYARVRTALVRRRLRRER